MSPSARFLTCVTAGLVLLWAASFSAIVVRAAPPAAAATAASAPAKGVRFLLPHSPEAPSEETDLTSLVEEYNRGAGAGSRVELIRRGESFSSLKDLVADFLAGDVPELAAIETSELPAIERMNLAHPIPIPASAKNPPRSLPFKLTVPVLIADQEMLFRAHANPDHLPRTWSELMKLVDTFARIQASELGAVSADRSALALPLQGARGLWLFEALTGKPLWRREPGGIRANRSLKGNIETIQQLIDRPDHLHGDETWEKSLQAFLERKAPLLIASTDTLPYIARQAAFRWTAGPVPKIDGGIADLEGGSWIVMTRESPEAVRFLGFLLSSQNAARWMASGGYLPLQSGWTRLPAWKAAAQKIPTFARLSETLHPKAHRTTDPEVVRIHSEWIRALRLIFTDRSQRLPLESTFTQLDSQLAVKSTY